MSNDATSKYRVEERAGNEVVWTREYRSRTGAFKKFDESAATSAAQNRRLVLVGPDHCVLPGRP